MIIYPTDKPITSKPLQKFGNKPKEKSPTFLPVPELVGGKPTNVVLQPSEVQKRMVKGLADRAEKVRSGKVQPTEDNMLRITNDGRKLALDQRLMNPLLPDDPGSKANACVDKVYEIWEKTKEQRSTQMIFCDLSTPKEDGFDVYNDVRDKLVAKGIPKEEVQFIGFATNAVGE